MSLCISVPYFCNGLVRGFNSPGLESIKNIAPDLIPTREIEEWVSSIAALGSLFGSITAFPFLHKFGRKYTIILASPIWVVGWFVIATATNWQDLIIGRGICGFSVGFVAPSVQVYVSECCNAEIRGFLGCMPALFWSLGILTSYIMGVYLNYIQMAWVNCAISGSVFFFLYPMPQSPIWFKFKRRYSSAEDSARWLGLEGFDSHSLEKHYQDLVDKNIQ